MQGQICILIVDREKILVDLIVHALRSETVEVLSAASAEEAVRLLDRHPELIIIDPAIPEGLALIRSISIHTSTPVIAFVQSDEFRKNVEAIGVERIVSKSEPLDALLQCIRSALDVEVRLSLRDQDIHVLVVDDEEAITELLSKFLGHRGYTVLTARSGIEALAVVTEDASLDIVLMDVVMPESGGIETLKQIMSRDPHPNVIMMSALSDRQIAQQALKLGAFDYLLKPLDLGAVETTITACLVHTEYLQQPWWKRYTRYFRGG